jgi:hypothetical protein
MPQQRRPKGTVTKDREYYRVAMRRSRERARAAAGLPGPMSRSAAASIASNAYWAKRRSDAALGLAVVPRKRKRAKQLPLDLWEEKKHGQFEGGEARGNERFA